MMNATSSGGCTDYSVNNNHLNHDGSSKDATEYFAYLCVYFWGYYFLLLFLDITAIFDKFVKKLGDSAYNSYQCYSLLHRYMDERGGKVNKQDVLNEVRDYLEQNDPANFFRISTGIDPREEYGSFRKWLEALYNCICCPFCYYDKEVYSKEFFNEVLLDGKSYYGITDFIFPNGDVHTPYFLQFFSCHCIPSIITFPPGMLEDSIYYLCNNHIILSQFMSSRGHPYSRGTKRMAFFAQNCLLFFIQVLITSAVKSCMLQESISIPVNYLAIPTLSIVIQKWFYYLAYCPCLARCGSSNYCLFRNCFQGCKVTGRIICYISLLIGVVILYAASQYLVSNYDTPSNAIFTFFWSVTVVATAQDIVYCFISYFGGISQIIVTWGYRIPYLGLWGSEIKLGSWFEEYIYCQLLQEGVDYVIHKNRYFLFCPIEDLSAKVGIFHVNDVIEYEHKPYVWTEATVLRVNVDGSNNKLYDILLNGDELMNVEASRVRRVVTNRCKRCFKWLRNHCCCCCCQFIVDVKIAANVANLIKQTKERTAAILNEKLKLKEANLLLESNWNQLNSLIQNIKVANVLGTDVFDKFNSVVVNTLHTKRNSADNL